jgi:YVTN family beta-propeller protein
MRRFLRSHVAVGVVALVAGASVAGGLAWAAIPNSASGVITACYSKTLSTKTLRVIDAQAGQKCTSSENTLSWQQNGQTAAQVSAAVAAAKPPCNVATLCWKGPLNFAGGSYGFNSPAGVAFDGSHIWVTNATGASVTELNASTGAWIRTLATPFGGTYAFSVPEGIAFDGSHLWVANEAGSSVTELNASDGSWVRTLSGGSYAFNDPEGVAFDGGHLWVTSGNSNSVTEINASTGSWIRTVSGGSYAFGYPYGVAFDGSHVWVTNVNGNSVTQVPAR